MKKKYDKPVRDINSTVALILAEGNKDKIMALHSAIGLSYERQFDKKINLAKEEILQELSDESLSKTEFNRLMESFSEIYHQRFNQRYFGEGNLLLTKIQSLLADKD